MSFETAKIGSAEIIFDKEETEKYYTEHIYSCECQDCRNFYEHIKRNPELLGFLADFGLNFNSVEEILSRDLGNDRDSLIHHEAYYVVCGRIEGNDVEFEKFGVKISFLKETSAPGDRQGEYFFIARGAGFSHAEIQDTVESEIERCNEYLKADVCKKAAILINEEVFEEQPAPEYENIRFITVKNDRDIEPLKELIK